MDKSKLKNLITIILALVNVFLLVLVVSDSQQRANAESKRTTAFLNVLHNQGISISEELVLPKDCPEVVELSRSIKKEKQLLSSLIGKCTVKDQGGDIYLFTGKDGNASIRSTGDIEIVLDTAVVPLDNNPIMAAEYTFKKLGISYDKDSIEFDKGEDFSCVTARCTYRGIPVLNAKISLYFSDNRLMFLRGRRPPDQKRSSFKANEGLDAISIIMTFLESNRRSGQVCSSILDVTICYLLDSPAIDGYTLTPVWQIKTDVGNFYFDSVTGKSRTT